MQKSLIAAIVLAVLLAAALTTLIVRETRRRRRVTARNNVLSITALTSMCSKSTARCPAPAGCKTCCRSHMLSMVELITSVMQKKAFVVCGTLLGMTRENRMIPYDDDMDMAIHANDVKLFETFCVPKLKAAGHIVELDTNSNEGLMITNPANSDQDNERLLAPPHHYYCVKYSERNSVHVDVAILTETVLKDGTRLLLDAPSSFVDRAHEIMDKGLHSTYRSWIMFHDDVYPVVGGRFHGVDVYTPGKARSFLQHMYGDNWNIPYNRDGHVAAPGLVPELVRVSSVAPSAYPNCVGLIINLPRDIERLHHCLSQFNREGIYAEVGGACCADNDADVLQELTFAVDESPPQRHKDWWAWGMTLSTHQKRCFASHFQCWKKAADASCPCLIVEDDIALPFDFKAILDFILHDVRTCVDNKLTPEALVVRLGREKWDQRKQPKVAVSPQTRSLFHAPFATGAWAYIVTPAAARVLRAKALSTPVCYPSDHWFNYPAPPYDSTFLGNASFPPDEYMFVEAILPFDVVHSYDLQRTDKERLQIVQELSTEMADSRSSGQ